MNKIFTAILLFFVTATQVVAWEVEKMNDTINSANFIVGSGCSGTLISKEHNLILTNHHCIDNAIRTVTRNVTDSKGVIYEKKFEELLDVDVGQRVYDKHRLVGEAKYKSQLVARWKESDLALLKTRADLPNSIAARVFSGDYVYRGETVYAVGNPLGLDATVTKGVVSSVNRMLRVSWADAEVPFIQIDSGITGGNSGGALFNDEGVLIGVPAAGARGNGHLGLAIPFFRVQEFLTENCYGEVWDSEAVSYEECVAAKKKEEDKEE